MGFPLEFDEVLALVGDLLGELSILYLHFIALLLVLIEVFLELLHLGLIALNLLNPISLSLQSFPLLSDYSVPHLLELSQLIF